MNKSKETTEIEKFWSKVNKTDTCWLWTAGLSSGYGSVIFGGKTQGAHRVSYKLLKGKIPEGLFLDHLCRVRNCVNPEHLEPVTNRENILRAAVHYDKCPKGHKYDEKNTYSNEFSRSLRICRTCRNLGLRKIYDKVITPQTIAEGKKFKEYRLSLGLTVKEMAKKLGVCDIYVYRYQLGRMKLPDNLLAKI